MLQEKTLELVKKLINTVIQQFHWALPYDHLFPGFWLMAYWMNEPEVNYLL